MRNINEYKKIYNKINTNGPAHGNPKENDDSYTLK